MTDPTTPDDLTNAIQAAHQTLFTHQQQGTLAGFVLVIATERGSQALAWYETGATVHTLTGALFFEMHELARRITSGDVVLPLEA